MSSYKSVENLKKLIKRKPEWQFNSTVLFSFFFSIRKEKEKDGSSLYIDGKVFQSRKQLSVEYIFFQRECNLAKLRGL